MAPCLRCLLTVAGDKKGFSLSEYKTVFFEVASTSRVSCGGRQTALITRLRMQTVLQSCEYASKAKALGVNIHSVKARRRLSVTVGRLTHPFRINASI